MEDKELFVNRLLQLFSFHGVKSFTMDDIAKEFGISKKTLYLKYPNKQVLLLEVFDLLLEKILVQHNLLKNEFTCPIECLYVGDLKMKEMNCPEKSIIFNQLQKYYPLVYEQHLKNVYTQAQFFFLENYNLGTSLGLYQAAIPIDYFTIYITQIFVSIENIIGLKHENIHENLLRQNAMLFYLMAITTQKGKLTLQNIQSKYEN